MSQTIFITGASKGIGLALARHLQARGHRVLGTSRNPAQTPHSDVDLIPLDVTDSASVVKATQEALARLGRVDVLINNAGYDLYAAAEDTSFADFMQQIEANFIGAVRMTQAMLPHFRQQKRGKLINMSSVGGLVALPFNSAYAASKFALEGYSESLRYELLPQGIYVSLVAPGAVRTDTSATSIQSVAGKPSAYGVESARIAANARAMGATATLTPPMVARSIAAIVDAPRPRLRYWVGGQTRVVMALRRLLPEAWFERFILSQFVQPYFT